MTPIRKLHIAISWAAALTIALGITMGVLSDFGKRTLPAGVHSPVLAMELLTPDPIRVSQILGPNGDPGDDRPQMIQQINWDWWFIVSYTVLFILLGILLYRRGDRWVGFFILVLILPAAIFDVLENFAILGLLGVPTSASRFPSLLKLASRDSAPRVWSLLKWALVFFLLLLSTRIYFDEQVPKVRRWIGYVAGTLAMIGSIVGLCGPVFNTDALIEKGSKLLAANLLVSFVYFATYSWLSNGLLPALDRLANSKCLRKLTRWPSDEDDSPPIDHECV